MELDRIDPISALLFIVLQQPRVSSSFVSLVPHSSFPASMKLSKSILSPGRAGRDAGPASLSSSLSRRLRTNGSIKGGQASPFFTATGKKRGCSFENTEPSSPKVTCIGQVRVKTKKKVKQQSRSLSRRRSGEVSFRKMEHANKDAVADGKPNEDGVSSRQQQQQQQQMQRYYYPSHGGASCQQPQGCPPHRNHRWGNFPVSICEALRTFGSEFSCLFPCKSSCFSFSEREKSVKHNGSGGNESGCGAVFARWLVSVNDGEGGKSREIELVVGGREDEEEEEEAKVSSIRRRHVLEDIEVKDDRIEEEAAAAARVSICIPPKNALLLMRCRSDPMKVATLMNKFRWDAPNHKEEDIEEIDGEEEHVVYEEEKQQEIRQCAEDGGDVDDDDDERPTEQEAAVTEEPNEEQDVNLEMELDEQEEELLAGTRDEAEELQEQIVLEGGGKEEEEEEKEELESNMSSFEHLLDQQNAGEHHEDCCPIDQDMDELESSTQHLSPSTESDETEIGSSEADEVLSPQPVEKTAAEYQVAEEDARSGSYDDDKNEIEQGIREVEDRQEAEPTAIQLTDSELEKNNQNQEFPSGTDESKTATVIPSALPECLLLMMCEPKLSMEVSKETWVCSTDFIRWLPERPRKTAKTTKDGVGGCHHEPVKRRLSIDSKTKRLARVPSAGKKDFQQLHQPPRSSCSLPLTTAASTMATMIEQKLVNGVGYEPLVLTRCKSEPMRTASVKLLPESCFWNNAVRNLEPNSRPAVGVGAAGVGF